MSANPLNDLALTLVDEYNRGDLEAWGKNFSPDYVHHNQYQPTFHGFEAYRQFQTGFQGSFPGVQIVAEDILTQGTLDSGSIVAITRIEGTGKGTWRGVPVTGKPVKFNCILNFKIADGKLVEGWEYDDYLALFSQIGLIPAPASATPAAGAPASA